MLKLTVRGRELYDESNNRFVVHDDVPVVLEHSLVSVSKWESKFQKPFLLSGSQLMVAEMHYYIQCMAVDSEEDLTALSYLEAEQISEIQAYIDSPQTATTFGEFPQKKSLGEVVTSELIYYWLVAFQIPWEAQHWHLNRLIALIRICNIKNSKPTRMAKRDIAERNRTLNEQRLAELGTSG